MPKKHPEDGPLDEVVAKGLAKKILDDPNNHGQPPEHAASQKLERLDDPAHQGKPDLDPKWKQNAAGDWIHEDEG